MNKLTAKQEAFCNYYVALNNGTQSAIKAGYSPKTAQEISAENLSKPMIVARLTELRVNKPLDPDIATVEERKRRLTEIYRANLVDFIDGKGNVKALSTDIPHHVALSEYSVTSIGHDDEEVVTKRTLKLRDPIAAIQEHNKMERVGAQDSTVINFNEIKILVVREEPGQLSSTNQVKE